MLQAADCQDWAALIQMLLANFPAGKEAVTGSEKVFACST